MSNTTLAPSHGMGPGSRSADHMPVIEVPDGLPPMTERPHETDLHETDLREAR
ncbi:MAG: hypothetical protein R2789_03700 [Microthrixaceae bacterium]